MKTSGRNFDYPMPQEGRMAKSYLWAVEKDARELRKQLKDGDSLPGWVQSKIVTAQDRIQTVNRYMGHKIARLEDDVSTAIDNPSKEMILGALVLGGLGYWMHTRKARALARSPVDISTLERPPPEFQPSNGQAVGPYSFIAEQTAKTNGSDGLVTLITLAVGTGVLYYVLTRG